MRGFEYRISPLKVLKLESANKLYYETIYLWEILTNTLKILVNHSF